MTDKFKAMIAEAAARANGHITAVQKGEYHPIVRVTVAGARSEAHSAVPARVACPTCGRALQ
jgi:hypothetical protein